MVLLAFSVLRTVKQKKRQENALANKHFIKPGMSPPPRMPQIKSSYLRHSPSSSVAETVAAADFVFVPANSPYYYSYPYPCHYLSLPFYCPCSVEALY